MSKKDQKSTIAKMREECDSEMALYYFVKRHVDQISFDALKPSSPNWFNTSPLESYYATHQIVELMSRSKRRGNRRLVASSRKPLPLDIIGLLIRDNIFTVRKALADNLSIDLIHLNDLIVLETDHRVMTSIAARSDITSRIARNLISKPQNPTVYESLAQNPVIPSEILEELFDAGTSNNWRVLHGLCKNKTSSSRLLLKIALRENVPTALVIRAHNTTPEIIELLTNHRYPPVRDVVERSKIRI